MGKHRLTMWLAKLAGTALFSGVISGVTMTAATAQPVHELRLAHYLPPMHNMAAKVLPDWAERLEKASNGRLKVTIYPA